MTYRADRRPNPATIYRRDSSVPINPLAALGSSFTLIYSVPSIVAAFLCSSLIGVGFGYLPARNASRLDPVIALSGD
jgi:ABC-type antimicrobial peptide transport system permease subunit